jgi:hypothetical protein
MRHAIREGPLSNSVGEEHSSGGSNRGREGSENPRAHSQAVTEFPLTAHVGRNSNQEVKYSQLVFSSIVQPRIKGSSLPDRVEVHSNGIGTGDDCTSNDVVSIEKRSSNRFTNSINVNRGCSNEGSDEAGGCRKKSGEHDSSEPTHVEAALSGCNPIAELAQTASAFCFFSRSEGTKVLTPSSVLNLKSVAVFSTVETPLGAKARPEDDPKRVFVASV